RYSCHSSPILDGQGDQSAVPAGSVGADAGRLRLQDNVSSCRLRDLRLRCAGEAFDPFLVIAVERAGMFAPELLEDGRRFRIISLGPSHMVVHRSLSLLE